MGVISNADVSVTLDGGTATAVVTWATDVAANSAVTYGQGTTPGAADGTIRDGSFVTSHSITLSGLKPGADYWGTLASVDERDNVCTCDITSPGINCTVSFRTPLASGPATYLSISASPNSISNGQTSQLSIATSATGSGGASGRSVKFNIHNGNDRGTFSPNPAMTDGAGNAKVSFTAAKNGKAQIQVLVDTLSDGVDVMVN